TRRLNSSQLNSRLMYRVGSSRAGVYWPFGSPAPVPAEGRGKTPLVAAWASNMPGLHMLRKILFYHAGPPGEQGGVALRAGYGRCLTSTSLNESCPKVDSTSAIRFRSLDSSA